MSEWLRWILPGFLSVSLLTAAALAIAGRGVEQDLATRVDAELVADGQAWASAEISGRTVTVMGTAPTLTAQSRAVEAAERVAGVYEVVDGSGVLPLQPSYVWGAERKGTAIRFTGFAPSDDAKAVILSAVKRLVPDAVVEDRMALARGQPVDFIGLAEFGVGRLAELSEGTVGLAGPALSISGTALDEAHFASAAQALSSAVPRNGELRSVRILPPRTERFTWRIGYDGDVVSLTGYIPSELVRREVQQAIRATTPSARIDDKTELASGAPDGFGSAAVFAAYQIARLTEATVAIDSAVLSIEGKARTVADYEAALAEIGARQQKPGGGIRIGAVDIVPAFVDPYVWRGERAGAEVTLSGYMPTLAAEQQVLLTAAKIMPDAHIVDHILVAAGDPKMDWIGAVGFSLGQLALLGKGSVSLTDHAYDIVGEASSSAAYARLIDTLGKTLPASMELRKSSVAPAAISPFTFSAVRTEERLTLSGFVPTNDVGKAIVDFAKPRFPNDEIEMQLQLAGGTPDDLVPALTAGLQAISRLSGGRIDLVDARLAISGAAVSEGAQRSIEEDLRSALPKSYELTFSASVAVGGDPLSGSECQEALNRAVQQEKIQFDGATASIEPESFGPIDRTAAIIQRCPAATIEVGAHTDSGGGSRKNQALSADRAGAVVERLVTDGVRRERLLAVGYGEIRPVASNSTAAGRAQNRRVEFHVVDR